MIAKHMKILIFDGYLRLNTCATRRAYKILYLQIFFNVKKQTEEKNEWKSESKGTRISCKNRSFVRRMYCYKSKTHFYARLSSKQRNCQRQWFMHLPVSRLCQVHACALMCMYFRVSWCVFFYEMCKLCYYSLSSTYVIKVMR